MAKLTDIAADAPRTDSKEQTMADIKRRGRHKKRVHTREENLPPEGNHRMNINIPVPLYQSFKKQAKAERKTMTALLVEIMAGYLTQRHAEGTLHQFPIPGLFPEGGAKKREIEQEWTFDIGKESRRS